ncbi:MAG: MGMT family protein [Candidatus Solibacter usitatus]|nr:MGMT family protein [Candidatus Solibacter usitatus]
MREQILKPLSDYARSVLGVVRRIPKGRVMSYGQVAEAAGYPRAVRAVASVLRLAPPGTPWHRVLGSGGRISLKGESGLEQHRRLEAEGLGFRGKRVVVPSGKSPKGWPKNPQQAKHKTL